MNHGSSLIIERFGISRAALAARGLCEYPEAECLEVAEFDDEGREYLLVPAAASAWRSLKRAALEDGIAIRMISGFRSISRQADLIQRKLDAGMSIEEVLTVLAPPGFSEHHTGRAVDVSTPGDPALDVEFDKTEAFQWMTRRASGFGFSLSYPPGNALGYQYEPWHWCFNRV